MTPRRRRRPGRRPPRPACFALAILTIICFAGCSSRPQSLRARGHPREARTSAFAPPPSPGEGRTRRRLGSDESSSARPGSSNEASLPARAERREGADRRRRSTHLAILVPAYNERRRIGSTLASYRDYLSRAPVYQYRQHRHRRSSNGNDGSGSGEICSGRVSMLVVDDGSSDGTAEYVRGNTWKDSVANAADAAVEGCWNVDEHVTCISLPENEGKGAAIERGMAELASSDPETIVLVADADGSGDVACVDDMLRRLEELRFDRGEDERPALVVGRRRYPRSKSALRALLSWGFRTCVSLIFLGDDLGATDTQCGFKLMPAATGETMYRGLNLRRWTQDVELLYRARLLGVPIGECDVNWVDKEGSKLVDGASDAVIVSLNMLGEIAKMRLYYVLGIWNVGTLE
ncbi:hypothetical protein ACHAWF_003201 [Thalassiosira exigua]